MLTFCIDTLSPLNGRIMDLCRETLCIVLISCFAKVYGQDLPQIAEEILPENKRINETAMLNCTVSKQGLNKVYWVHKYTQTIITVDDKVDLDPKFNGIVDGLPKYDVYKQVIGDRSTYTLVVRRLQPNDAGVYVCRVRVVGSQNLISKNGKIVVLVPPVIIQAQTSQTLTLYEGDYAIFVCAATGSPAPNITWMRADGKALPYPVNTLSYRGHKLTLTHIKPAANGVYRCIADNNINPHASHDAILRVKFRPFVKAMQSSYGHVQDLNITIECLVAGDPAPDLQWYKVKDGNFTVINNDDKYAVHDNRSQNSLEFWFRLTIIKAQANDAGQYVCRGTNILGRQDARILVYVSAQSTVTGSGITRSGLPTTSAAKRSVTTISLATSLIIWYILAV